MFGVSYKYIMVSYIQFILHRINTMEKGYGQFIHYSHSRRAHGTNVK